MNSEENLTLELVEILLYYDGEQISHYKSDDKHYLLVCIDIDKDNNWIYLAAELDINYIDEYKNKSIDLLSVLSLGKSWKKVNETTGVVGTYSKFSDIPDEYLPEEGAFYEND